MGSCRSAYANLKGYGGKQARHLCCSLGVRMLNLHMFQIRSFLHIHFYGWRHVLLPSDDPSLHSCAAQQMRQRCCSAAERLLTVLGSRATNLAVTFACWCRAGRIRKQQDHIDMMAELLRSSSQTCNELSARLKFAQTSAADGAFFMLWCFFREWHGLMHPGRAARDPYLA